MTSGLENKLHPTSAPVLKWLNVYRSFKLKQIAEQHGIGPDGGINEALVGLVQVVEHVEIAAQDQRLVYAQDILACSLSDLAVFSHRVSLAFRLSCQC